VNLIISVNQNVPGCAAVGTNNVAGRPGLWQQQPVFALAESSYHGLHVSFVAAADSMGFLPRVVPLSKAMDNVGEFFSARRSIRSISRRTGGGPTTISGTGSS